VPKVLSLTADDIGRAAAAHIEPARMAVVVVGDREKIAPSVASLELGDASEVALA
jgi:predicted Zn-dependent peptidase